MLYELWFLPTTNAYSISSIDSSTLPDDTDAVLLTLFEAPSLDAANAYLTRTRPSFSPPPRS